MAEITENFSPELIIFCAVGFIGSLGLFFLEWTKPHFELTKASLRISIANIALAQVACIITYPIMEAYDAQPWTYKVVAGIIGLSGKRVIELYIEYASKFILSKLGISPPPKDMPPSDDSKKE